MRRANDLPSKRYKIKEKGECNENRLNHQNIKHSRKIQIPFDILIVLSKFDRRIKSLCGLKRKITGKIHGIFKKSYERCVIYNERLSFSMDLQSFINLQTLFVKNSLVFDFGTLNCKFLKTLYISNCEELKFTKTISQIQIEEIYLKNLNIDINVLKEVISFFKPISLNLNRVNIVYEKKGNTVSESYNENRNNILSTARGMYSGNNNPYFGFNSIDNVFVNQEFNDHSLFEENSNIPSSENVITYLDTFENQKINSSFLLLLNESKLKSISSIDTNINLETFMLSKIFYNLNFFVFYKSPVYIFLSYRNILYNILNVCTPQLLDFSFLRDLEKISVDNLGTLHSLELKNIKCLRIVKNKVDDTIIHKIHHECPNILEIFFIDCYFSSNSFYRFVDLFCSKLKILSLKNSVVPLDSLIYIKNRFKCCKVVFKDGSRYNINNYLS